jgi:hypothetical protein
MQVGYLRNDKRSIHFAPLIANAASPKRLREMPSTKRFGINRDARACLRPMRAETHGTI